MRGYYGFAPYVPVAQRRANALRQMEALRKQGKTIRPVESMKGRSIAKTFWGDGWCRHLEKFSDYENRLPRGRTYVRNGSVCHLEISPGRVEAYVAGSELYEVAVTIKTMPKGKWDYIRQSCTGRIGSLLELLQGKFSDEVMAVVTDRDDGLFPLPGEMTFECSCPDWAVMCKHVAAVLYGVGARLDAAPDLLFRLRGVDHEELIGGEALAAATSAGRSGGRRRRLKGDVAAVFGVDLEETGSDAAASPAPPQGRTERASANDSKAADSGRKASRVTAEDREAVAWLLDRLTGETVDRIVQASGLSHATFARRIGVSQTAVTVWIKKGAKTLSLRPASRKGFEDCLHAEAEGRISCRADKQRIAKALYAVAQEMRRIEEPSGSATRDARTTKARAKKRGVGAKGSSRGTGKRRPAKRAASSSTKRKPKPEASKPSEQDGGRGKRKPPAAPPSPKAWTGRRVAALRKRMKLSAAAFGERVGVSAQTVYHWERNKGKLRLRTSSEKALSAL